MKDVQEPSINKQDPDLCPLCGSPYVNLYDTVYQPKKDKTLGLYQCFRCTKGYKKSLGKGITILID